MGSGVTLTFWKSKNSLLKVTVSPERARRMMSSDWSVRAPRSLEDTPKPVNSSRLKPIPDTELETAARENINGRNILGKTYRIVEWHQQHARCDANPVG